MISRQVLGVAAAACVLTLPTLAQAQSPAQSQTPNSPAAAPAVRKRPRGDEAVPRGDRNSQLAHEQLLEKARKGGIDLYFVGDSITRRWGTSDAQYKEMYANWTTNFFGWNAGNFGWGGDTTQNILWRLQNGELNGVNPKVVVLMAGTNNLGNQPPADGGDVMVEQITLGLRTILDTIRQKAPGATILLMGVTPHNNPKAGTSLMPIINRVNERAAQLADGRKVRFLNINDRLADKDGQLFEGVMVDGLHLSVKGYQIWADALKPVLTELLGAPAKEDHAPPPTGDPSAKK